MSQPAACFTVTNGVLILVQGFRHDAAPMAVMVSVRG
jgi:hypothetical protein